MIFFDPSLPHVAFCCFLSSFLLRELSSKSEMTEWILCVYLVAYSNHVVTKEAEKFKNCTITYIHSYTHIYIYMLTTYTGKKEENPRSDMVFNQTFQNSHLLIFFIMITRMIRTIWACFLYSSLQYYPNQVRYER